MKESDAVAAAAASAATTDFSAADLPEELKNRFRVEGVLGRGGMGTVFRAVHLGLDRVVALKLINPEIAANTNIAQRFAREARLMAKLRHPRAATIYDTGVLSDGHSYIVMEYVEGKTLSQIIREEGPMHYRRAVEIAAGVCDVLQAAHEIGIIHRDLKPANVMINDRGVFVLDFGIAKILESHKEHDTLGLSMTGTGIIVGSPYYMSPEQCLGQPVEARSDLYSLGVLLYEALAGNPPFTDKTISAVIVKHATAQPRPLNELRPDVPLPLVAAINQLLAKNPEQRPPTASAARASLEAAIYGQAAAAGSELNTAMMPQPPGLTGSRLNTIAENQVTQHSDTAASTQNLAAAQSAAAAAAATASTAARRGNSARNVGIAAGLLLVALLSVVGVGWMVWRAYGTPASSAETTNYGAGNNNAAYSSQQQQQSSAHSHHDMSSSSSDYAMTNSPTTADDKSNSVSMPILSSEEADRVITKITQETQHRADGMQIVKTPKDTALVCLHNMIAEKQTHLFVVERPNPQSAWDISARVSLDVPEFNSPNWSFEPHDVDKDGFEEVIFSAANSANTTRRVLVYVPRTRQSYWILADLDASGKPAKTTFSPNAETPNSAAFKSALEQYAAAKRS
jgi:predicted Ser/Thr protein kinase